MGSKIWTVLRSEFARRVRSKWYIVMTLLGPLLLLGILFIPAIIGVVSVTGNVRTIALVDRTDVLAERLATTDEARFKFLPTRAGLDSLRRAVEAGELDGYLLLPSEFAEGQGEASYYSVEGGGMSLENELRNVLDGVVDAHRLEAADASAEVVAILSSKPDIRLFKLTDEGEQADASAASSILGFIMGFFMYGTILFYGAYVMHGVMEEKQSRVLEIIISSVRPFELLMGKVLGIGAMGLLQMVVWVVILVGLTMSAGGVISLFLDPSDFNLPASAGQEELLGAADFALPAFEPALFIWFLLFFLGGYLLYSSLFAAVGSTVENSQDAQGMMLPLTLLIVIPILFISVVVEAPNSTLSVLLSFVPFFSPILMIVRVAVTSVPFWQVLLSFLLLCGTFVGAVWVSSRIYRIGILMYGKKPTFRELARWFAYQ